jgi:MSHA biogenesis protein MshI
MAFDHAGPDAAQALSRIAASTQSGERGAAQVRWDCSTVLQPDEYQMLPVEAPDVAFDERRAAVRWQLRDRLDGPVEEAVVDIFALPASHARLPNGQPPLVAVASRQALVDARRLQFSRARLDLRVVDIPEMAQRNIADAFLPGEHVVAMVSFSATGCLFTVSGGAELYMARRFDFKPPFGLQAGGDAGMPRERIAAELRRSLDFFQRQYPGVAVDHLVIGPLGTGAEALREFLAAHFKLPVSLLDLAQIFDLSAVGHLRASAQQQVYFSTLGAALRPRLALA